MKISFIVPAYNEEKLIRQCLESIQREIVRVGIEHEVEIIVVNNASTDHTKEIAQSFANILVIDELHKGVRFARQAGFRASRGELVANVDADTVMPISWLSRVIETFEKHPEIVATSGPYRYYDVSPIAYAITRGLDVLGFIFYLWGHYVRRKDAMICGGNLVIRRWALDKIGGYDTTVASAADDAHTLMQLEQIGIVRWDWKSLVYASGRRFRERGVILTYIQWISNYVSVRFSGKALSEKYPDVRTS